MSDNEMSLSPEMLIEVKNEATDLIERLGVSCANLHLAIQHDVEVTRSEVDELFRTLHTLKSVCQMAGLTPLMQLLHTGEDKIDLVRKREAVFTSNDLDALSDVQSLLERVFAVFPKIKLEEYSDDALKLEKSFGVCKETSEIIQPDGDAQEKWNKLQSRSENLVCVIFEPELYSDLADFEASEAFENLQRVGEIYFHCHSSAGAFVVCASDLEAEMIEALLGKKVFSLNKSLSQWVELPAPWNLIRFSNQDSSKSSQKYNDIEAQKAENEATSGQEAWNAAVQGATNEHDFDAQYAMHDMDTAGLNAEPENEMSSGHGDEHGDEHDGEDFDSVNIGAAAPPGMMDLDPEMLQDFLSNADDLLDTLSASMLELEDNPSKSEAIESIFRAAHTIKGTAGMFGFRAIERVTHICENLFDRIRKGTLSVSPSLMDGLFLALDKVREMFTNLKKGESAEIPINDVLSLLAQGSSGKKVEKKSAGVAPKTENTAGVAPKTENTAKPVAAKVVNAPLAQTTVAKSIEPEKITKSVVSEETLVKNNEPPKGKSQTSAAPADAAAAEVKESQGTLKVDLKRLDILVNLVGELVIDRTRFARVEEALRSRNANSEVCHLMTESVLLFGRHMNEVQSTIMKIRMVPVGNAFFKFTRVVRDLSRQIGKEIDLQIEGGETELDKTLVEEIGDPLVHLIRNSVDHGIEMPDVREAAGKPRRGTIRLRASQDGNMVVITVSDNGKGLQIDRIREKGLQTGLIKPGDQPTDREIFNLIFEAGFSTADKVTNISGRGVGMDVVKKNIVKLKGVIDLDSTIGVGTTTAIKLPLTLAIIPSLMVETSKESYAIPLVNVIESIRISPSEIQKIGSGEFVRLRDAVLPLISLADIFNLHAMEDRIWYRQSEERSILKNSYMTSKRHRERIIFVVVGVGEKRVGVIVNQLLGQQEIVIKPLGQLMTKHKGVAGGCVLGNGRVALVLDVGEIIDDFSLSKNAKQAHLMQAS